MKHILASTLLFASCHLFAQSGKLPSVTVETMDGKKVNTATRSNNC